MFFGAFASGDATFARWSANPLAMLWPEMLTGWPTGSGKGLDGHHCRELELEPCWGRSFWGSLPISAGRLAITSLVGFSRMKNFCGGHS
jgi:hypothetical protein